MQTLPVHYTDRIWGFQAQLVKTVTRAEIKVITGKNHFFCEDWSLQGRVAGRMSFCGSFMWLR